MRRCCRPPGDSTLAAIVGILAPAAWTGLRNSACLPCCRRCLFSESEFLECRRDRLRGGVRGIRETHGTAQALSLRLRGGRNVGGVPSSGKCKNVRTGRVAEGPMGSREHVRLGPRSPSRAIDRRSAHPPRRLPACIAGARLSGAVQRFPFRSSGIRVSAELCEPVSDHESNSPSIPTGIKRNSPSSFGSSSRSVRRGRIDPA